MGTEPSSPEYSSAYETPASSSNRLTNAKSLSPYCTLYSKRGYVAVSKANVAGIDHSPRICATISGVERCWKMRQLVRCERSQRLGRSVSAYVARPLSSGFCCSKRVHTPPQRRTPPSEPPSTEKVARAPMSASSARSSAGQRATSSISKSSDSPSTTFA